ncbi:MAG TPA: class I SAM-dependent methyltransferase [Ktedonobacterales bacterium]|nr:class I SAM-dependent methyltransferase [Ktedonobacterales bacterium]
MPNWWPFRRKQVTASLDGAKSSRQLYGRDYVAGVPYGLPADLNETNRLDFQHFALRVAFKGNYAAPIGTPRSILDVGCGTGRWAMDVAQQFPGADVVGIDVNEPPAHEGNPASGAPDVRPANFRFVAANALEGLPFADQSFDFTHQRLLFFAIPADRWPFVLSELYRVTRPGGWVEVAEGHFGYKPAGPATQKITEYALAALLARGIDPRVGPLLATHLGRAGFPGAQMRVLDLPVGAWAGRVGTLLATNLAEAHRSARPLLLSQGVSEAEWEALFNAMLQEWEQQRSTWPFYIAYAQRPG